MPKKTEASSWRRARVLETIEHFRDDGGVKIGDIKKKWGIGIGNISIILLGEITRGKILFIKRGQTVYYYPGPFWSKNEPIDKKETKEEAEGEWV